MNLSSVIKAEVYQKRTRLDLAGSSSLRRWWRLKLDCGHTEHRFANTVYRQRPAPTRVHCHICVDAS